MMKGRRQVKDDVEVGKGCKGCKKALRLEEGVEVGWYRG